MPLEIAIDCPYCGIKVQWVYDQEEERIHRNMMGCPGAQCTWTYILSVNDITTERAEEIKSEQSPGIGD
jgi:hypothetical protein